MKKTRTMIKAKFQAEAAAGAAPVTARTDEDDAYDNRLGKAVAAHTELTGTVPTGLRLESIVKRIKKQIKEEADSLRARVAFGRNI